MAMTNVLIEWNWDNEDVDQMWYLFQWMVRHHQRKKYLQVNETDQYSIIYFQRIVKVPFAMEAPLTLFNIIIDFEFNNTKLFTVKIQHNW